MPYLWCMKSCHLPFGYPTAWASRHLPIVFLGPCRRWNQYGVIETPAVQKIRSMNYGDRHDLRRTVSI
jgi:hypothetical protein